MAEIYLTSSDLYRSKEGRHLRGLGASPPKEKEKRKKERRKRKKEEKKG